MKITPTKSDKIALFIIITLIVGYFLYTRPQSATNFYNENDIISVIVMNGNSGKTTVITDREKIYWVNQYLKRIRFSRKIFTPRTSGWTYRFTIKTSTRTADFVIAGSNSHINHKPYSMDYKLVEDSIKDFYKKITE